MMERELWSDGYESVTWVMTSLSRIKLHKCSWRMSPAAVRNVNISSHSELVIINLMQEEYKTLTFGSHHQHVPVDVNGEAGHLRVYRVQDCGLYLKYNF